MSNLIPPLVSDSPPPPPSEEDEDDEFDEFRGSNDISYNGCESFSATPSPEQTPEKHEDSSTNEHNPEFIFKPVSSVTNHRNIEYLPTDSFKSKENIVESRNHNVVSSIKPLKENISEISCSEEHLDIATKVLQNNNVTNKDNIPSQFIVESENAGHKIDDKCDTKNIIKGPNEILIDKNVVNDPQILDVLVETPKEFNITQNLESESFTPSARESIGEDSIEEVNSEILNSKDTGFSKSESNYQTAGTLTSDRELKLERNEIDESSNITHFTEIKSIEDKEDKLISHQKYNHLGSEIVFNWENNEFDSSNEDFDDNFQAFSSNTGEQLKGMSENESEHVNIKEQSNELDSHSTKYLKAELDNVASHLNEQNLPIDDFANFSSFSANDAVAESLQQENIDVGAFSKALGDHEAKNQNDFATFEAFGVQENDEDFDEFASFPIDTIEKAPALVSQESEDDFDDFGEFTSSTTDSSKSKPFLLLNEKESFKKTEEIIKDFFVPSEEVFEDFQYFELGKGDPIFTQLRDVTDTPAFGYHWSKSTSQKLFLKSLNIDSRNILYGHSWNSSVPRFAANLGVQPLEPVKMEPLNCTPTDLSPPTTQHSRSESLEVPSAQFDWTSSGLVNPLDYCQTTLLDLEQLVASFDIPNTNPIPPHTTSSPMKVDEDWDDWLKYAPSEPTKAIKSESTAQTESDYEEFTSFQSSKPPTEWPSVPLRETYISDVPQAHIDIDVVLQPTIVTPELPRKSLSSENITGFSENTIESKIDTKENDDEEFDDFQMVYPVNKQLDKGDKNIEIKTELDKYNRENVVVIEDNQDSFETATTTKSPEPEVVTLESEEDFTEYHSSVPLPQLQPQSQPLPQLPPQSQSLPQLQPQYQPLPQLQPQSQPSSILEPILQPTPVYSTPSSTQINWPDPGISHDELKRFEAAFSLPLPQKKEEKPEPEKPHFQHKQSEKRSKEVQQKSTISIWDSPPKTYKNKVPEMKEQPKKIESKQNSLEEDEWSDFVSVQKPSPIHKAKFSDRTQNSSPDLTLSVLTLGSIQPAKQPIPVITPQGLVQTKLSANANPTVQPKIVNPRPSYDLPSFRPSIISNQFASQAYNFGSASQSSQNNQNGQDDDEWGEFVSSPLPPQYQNSSTTVGHHGWNSFLPSNQSSSGHLNQGLYANQTSGRSVNTNLQKKSNALSGLVLPELDFLALKERTGVSRKK